MFDGPLRDPAFLQSGVKPPSMGEATRSRNRIPGLRAAIAIATAVVATITPGTASASIWTADTVVSSLSSEELAWTQLIDRIRNKLDRTQAEGLERIGEDTVVAFRCLPSGLVTPDGSYELLWDHGRHYLLAEVFPSGRYDWFYRDRETGRLDGEEDISTADTSRLRRRLERNLRDRYGPGTS